MSKYLPNQRVLRMYLHYLNMKVRKLFMCALFKGNELKDNTEIIIKSER